MISIYNIKIKTEGVFLILLCRIILCLVLYLRFLGAHNDPVNLPKWELGLLKKYVNTKLRKANKCGPFGSSWTFGSAIFVACL